MSANECCVTFLFTSCCVSSLFLPVTSHHLAFVSQLRYKEPCDRATPVSMTPEIERVRRNQEQLSTVKYRGEIKQATAISDPPELKRVKENQKNLSNV